MNTNILRRHGRDVVNKHAIVIELSGLTALTPVLLHRIIKDYEDYGEVNARLSM